MANQSRLEVVLALINEASEELQQVTDDFEQAGESASELQQANEDTSFSFTELNSALGIAQRVLGATQQVYQATIGSTLEYGDQVRALSTTIGATAEESSRLIQAADDVGVSSETLSSALEVAIRKGVRPTIEGIGQLADEYNAIEDPIERAAFLQENFGRGGVDLQAFMLKGSAGIRELGASADATGQVLSGAMLQSQRDLEIQTDQLQDAYSGLTIQLSQSFIPALTEVITTLNDNITQQQLYEQALAAGLVTSEEVALQSGAITGGYQIQAVSIEALTARLDTHNASLMAQTQELTNWRDESDRANATAELAAAKIQEEETAVQNYSGQLTILNAALSGPLKAAQDEQATKTAEITQKQSELNFQIGEATRIYGENSPKVTDLKTQYADLTTQLVGVNEQYSQNVNQLIFAAAQSSLFADGVQTGEVPALMAMGEMLGIVDKGTADVYAKFSELAEHNKAEGVPSWSGMTIEAAKLSQQLNLQTTPAVKTQTKETDALALASKNADEKLGIVFTDLIGIKAAADSASKSVGQMSGALNSIPQHVGPYGGGQGGSAPSGAPRYAEGGIAAGPMTGYPAELHGTEAVVPLPDGKSIPVQMSGGGAGEMRLVLTIPVTIDGHEVGRASFDGTLSEARARGLALSV
jgi:chromosome segregation ATPase